MEITREIFEAQRRPRFGTANPELMRLEFWEWMVRGCFVPPKHESEDLLASMGQIVRGGILKSSYGPWRARDLFKIPLNREEGPIWTFDRMKYSTTDLADGRTIYVGGEHEDYYDPDFCIYNDVIVISPGNRVEIFGYPREVFPPTDFHTATLIDERLLLIGCLGYPKDRRPGHTPVYSLDVSTYRITKVDTKGHAPGWIYDHRVEYSAPGIISLGGGTLVEVDAAGQERHWQNSEDYELDLGTGVWRQTTNRGWRQFSIAQEDQRFFAHERGLCVEDLLPQEVEHTVLPCEDFGTALIVIEEVPISITVDAATIQIVVQGELNAELARRVAEIVCQIAEAKLERRCVLEEYAA